MSSQESSVLEALEELMNDSTIPKSLHLKISNMVKILNQKEEFSIKKNKIIGEIEDLSGDATLNSFTRTQLFNVASLLENS